MAMELSKFQFTPDQIENLKSWKNNLNTEIARSWIQEEDEAESQTTKILNDPKFIQGENLSPERLDELFSFMKAFSSNQNLSNLLYRNNGLEEFNQKLRGLIHDKDNFVERVDEFFRLKSIGIQTLSQFLMASDASQYPLITSQTMDVIGINSDQDQAALEDARDEFGIKTDSTLLDRTLEYFRNFIIFKSIKNLLNLEKYSLVNNLLWYIHKQEMEGPEGEIQPFGSISIENDLRDFLSTNPSIIEKGMQLIKKEYDTREVGRIDLLCLDKKGYHVIVELKKGRKSDEVVGQTLRYLGWIKQHVSKKTRGIIIVNEPDERLNYAITPLNNLIQLKYYKVNFEIKDRYE